MGSHSCAEKARLASLSRSSARVGSRGFVVFGQSCQLPGVPGFSQDRRQRRAISRHHFQSKVGVGLESQLAFVSALEHGGRGESSKELLIGPSFQFRFLPQMHLDFAPLWRVKGRAARQDVYRVRAGDVTRALRLALDEDRRSLRITRSTMWARLFLAWLLVLGCIAGPMHAAAPQVPDVTGAFAQTVQPFLKTYCTGCHSGGRPAAQLDLGQYATVDSVVQDFSRWNRILTRLSAQEMPPRLANNHPIWHGSR